MEQPPRFDFRDVLIAPARALSAKQILVMTGFLCLALVVFDLGYYVSLLIDGQSLESAYSVYGIFPFAGVDFGGTGALIVYAVGIMGSVFALMLGFFSVAAINIEAIRGNRFFSASGATRFAFQRIRQILLSELAIAGAVLFVVLLFVILGLVTRIPVVGELIYSVFFVIPNFVIGLFTVFVIFVLVVSIILMPAVSAAERNNESFTSIVETFSTIIRQPFRWLGYTVYSAVAAKLCSFVYAYFAYRAVQFMLWSSFLGSGDNIWTLTKSALWHLPTRSAFVRETFNVFPGVSWGFSIPNVPYLPTHSFAGHIMAIMLLVIFASVIGYALAIIASAQARGYVVIRYLKDTYKVTDEKPLFFQEEHVNPPIDGEANLRAE